YIFISHNITVVDYKADRNAVMTRGRIIEIAPRQSLFSRPVHPYTRALLSAVPYPDLDRPLDLRLISLGGASNEEKWPPQFRRSGAGSMSYIDLGGRHRVLVNPNVDARELEAPEVRYM